MIFPIAAPIFSVHDRINAVQGQPNPMVGDTALWEIIGANALVAHSRSYLTAAQTGDFAVQTLLLHFVELAGQHPHTFLPVLDLAPLLLTGDHDARGLVD